MYLNKAKKAKRLERKLQRKESKKISTYAKAEEEKDENLIKFQPSKRTKAKIKGRNKPSAKQVAHLKRQEEIARMKAIGGKGPRPPHKHPVRDYPDQHKKPNVQHVFNPNHKTIVTYEKVSIGHKLIEKKIPWTLGEVRDYLVKNKINLEIRLDNGEVSFYIPFFLNGKHANYSNIPLLPRAIRNGNDTYIPSWDGKPKTKKIYSFDRELKRRVIIGEKEIENPIYKFHHLLTGDELLQFELLAFNKPDATEIGRKLMSMECIIIKYFKGIVLPKKVKLVKGSEQFKTVRKSVKVSKVLKKIPIRALEEHTPKVKTPKTGSKYSLVCISNINNVEEDNVQTLRLTREEAGNILMKYTTWNYIDKATYKSLRSKGKALNRWNYKKFPLVEKEKPAEKKKKKPISKTEFKPNLKKINSRIKRRDNLFEKRFNDGDTNKKKGKVALKKEQTFQTVQGE